MQRTCTSTAVHQKCHTSRRPPDVILRRSFTRPSTTLAVIEGLGTRLVGKHCGHVLSRVYTSPVTVYTELDQPTT